MWPDVMFCFFARMSTLAVIVTMQTCIFCIQSYFSLW